MDVKIKFCKKDKCMAQLVKQLQDANYNITISRPYHGSIPMLWVDDACSIGSKKIVKVVTDLLGKDK